MENAAGSPVIVIRGLHKYYGRVHALRGLDLTVQPCSIFGFLGPNGAGKTTTIRCLLDLIRPQSGTMRVFGLDPRRDSRIIRARCGYLPGELHFQEGFTVRNALDFYNRLRKRRASWAAMTRLAERLDLDLSMAVKNLSKGNRQKLGLVLALMHEPELLLLDEPTSGLDPLVQQEVMCLIREARDRGATVFFSSHVLSEVQDIASQVAIIRKGKVVEIAATKDLLDRAVRTAVVKLKETGSLTGIDSVPGVSLIQMHDAFTFTLRIEGEIGPAIRYLADYPVQDMYIERPSLEEVFLSYYGADTDGDDE